MARTLWFRLSSQLQATPAEVLQLVGTMAGVNQELFPLARMTYPADQVRIARDSMPLGRRAFRSWILLFGIIPIDYDDIMFTKFYPEGGFVEHSTMLSIKTWRHERTLEVTQAGCLLTDHVSLVPRIPTTGPLFYLLGRALFRWRHAYLRRTFGCEV